MKKMFLGILIGACLMFSAQAFAEDGLQKVEAYLRPSLPITLNGNPVVLDHSPVMYDGTTHLNLRDIAKLFGVGVNWNDATQTVELATYGSVSAPPTVTGSVYSPDATTPPTAVSSDWISALDVAKLGKLTFYSSSLFSRFIFSRNDVVYFEIDTKKLVNGSTVTIPLINNPSVSLEVKYEKNDTFFRVDQLKQLGVIPAN